MPKQPFIPPSIATQLKRNWGWLLTLGILFIIFGSIGLTMATQVTFVSMLIFAVLLIVAGLSQLFDVCKSEDWEGSLWHALIALLYIVGGCLVAYDPFLVSEIITAMLGGLLIVIGVVRILMAIKLSGGKGWGWLFIAGVVAIVLGGLILMQWPVSGLWFIGLCISIELIISGWSYVILAFSFRQLG